VRTSGFSSFAHGSNHIVTGSYASTFGNGNSGRAYNSFVIGRNNDSMASSSTSSWVVTDPLFIIGNGASSTSRSNALVVLKNGVTGIGVNPIGTALDYGMLQIKSFGSRDNLTLLQGSSNNRWGFYVGGSGPDLNLYLNGVYKGRFDNVDGAYFQASDRRLKKDIIPVSKVLDKVLQLKAYQYHYLDNKLEDPYSHGFIAQDVAAIFPDFTSSSTDKEGKEIFSLNYSKFSVIALRAIQEQQEIIENQQQQINDLTRRLEAIEKIVK
jgi:hypothetical protein